MFAARDLGRDAAEIKHQTTSLLLHIVNFTNPRYVLFFFYCFCFWKPRATASDRAAKNRINNDERW